MEYLSYFLQRPLMSVIQSETQTQYLLFPLCQGREHLLNLQLIATTVKILFQKENTEGVDQWQTTASKREKQ